MRSILLAVFILICVQVRSQSRVLLGGVITNHVTGQAVANVHVLNLTDSLATISSETGAFRIPVHEGDSLVFSSIGYATKAWIVSASDLTADFIRVKMIQRNYELAEVEVNPFGTKDQFRKRFMELEVDDGTIEIVGVQAPPKERRTIPIEEDANEIKKAKYLLSPATFLYGNLSKEAKARQELHRLNRKKERNRYNYQKFNEQSVHRITGYEGELLVEFMQYCNFSQDQIYRYSDYELTVAILQKQRSFEQQRQKTDHTDR